MGMLAQEYASMICYLWFAAAQPSTDAHPLQDAARSALQFQPSPVFVRFVFRILERTLVSQSVIVLSLQYVWRLKKQNSATFASKGSELRVAVVALLCANKFVDDHTYSNVTWSEISGIGLAEVNKMEREFLAGVNYRLYVDHVTYESWLHLLEGLVAAKQKAYTQWQSTRRASEHDSRALPAPPLRHLRPLDMSAVHRAQSFSRQVPFTFTANGPASNPFAALTPVTAGTAYAPPLPVVDTRVLAPKRPAHDAFSPPSAAAHAHLHPAKRPVSVDMSMFHGGLMSSTARPLLPPHASPDMRYTTLAPTSTLSWEPEAAFAGMSLAAAASKRNPPPPPLHAPTPHYALSAPYVLEFEQQSEPQPLYFYALASSDGDDPRKRKLRYHYPDVAPHPPPALAPAPDGHALHSTPRFAAPLARAPTEPAIWRMAMSVQTSPVALLRRSPSSAHILHAPPHMREPYGAPPPLEIPVSAGLPTPPPTARSPPASAHVQRALFANAGPAGVRMPWAPRHGTAPVTWDDASNVEDLASVEWQEQPWH